MWSSELALLALPLMGALLLFPGKAKAQQIGGPRSLGMGDASRAVGTSNDTIFSNPAGISLYPRYNIEMFFRRNTWRHENQFSLSLLDSKSGPVGGALAYTYEWGGESGNTRVGSRLDVASSYQLASFLLFGITMHYLGLTTSEGKVNRVTGDTGFLFVIANFLTIGLTGANLINPVEETAAAPRMFGGGIGLRLFRKLQLGFDWRKSVERDDKPAIYNVGAEYVFEQSFPVRAGYVSDDLAGEQRWSVGLGFAASSFGIDLSYSRSIKKTDNVQEFAIGVRLFL